MEGRNHKIWIINFIFYILQSRTISYRTTITVIKDQTTLVDISSSTKQFSLLDSIFLSLPPLYFYLSRKTIFETTTASFPNSVGQ